MNNDQQGDWRTKAESHIETMRGLSDKHPQFAIAREELRIIAAQALDDAMLRISVEGENLSRSIGKGTDRLVESNSMVVEEQKGNAAQLADAIDSLAAASNSGTRVMARLQWLLIVLTAIYVALTAVIAWATYAALSRPHP